VARSRSAEPPVLRAGPPPLSQVHTRTRSRLEPGRPQPQAFTDRRLSWPDGTGSRPTYSAIRATPVPTEGRTERRRIDVKSRYGTARRARPGSGERPSSPPRSHGRSWSPENASWSAEMHDCAARRHHPGHFAKVRGSRVRVPSSAPVFCTPGGTRAGRPAGNEPRARHGRRTTQTRARRARCRRRRGRGRRAASARSNRAGFGLGLYTASA
jgi:hypothetical protein